MAFLSVEEQTRALENAYRKIDAMSEAVAGAIKERDLYYETVSELRRERDALRAALKEARAALIAALPHIGFISFTPGATHWARDKACAALGRLNEIAGDDSL